jgi:hypothetical protein
MEPPLFIGSASRGEPVKVLAPSVVIHLSSIVAPDQAVRINAEATETNPVD